uniref:Uncharacterized protein n=1 Tax=Sipha flava TaxID=143950 RepID=A0A2S2QV07_9HEMI
MIEHLYDLIRVEETCCGGGGGGTWYSTGSVHLDDITSTITTKAVTVGPGGRRERPDVRSVGTGVPSLDRLRPRRTIGDNAGRYTGTGTSVGTVASIGTSTLDRYYRRPLQKPPPPPPPSVSDYMDPADLLYSEVHDEGSYADIYCELADLRGGRSTSGEYRAVSRPPPPVPDKPTEV